MRIFIFTLFIFLVHCKQNAQETNSNQQNNDMQEASTSNKKTISFDEVIIDNVADIKKGTNEKSATFIKSRLEKLVGNFLERKCRDNNVNYPPKFILFRFFKYEKEFEVWAGNSQKDSLKRILLLPVCAVDDEPGTKLEQGDGKTPEGFYNSPLYYGSTADFMWVKLNNSEIDTYGKVGYGSSFKMCLDYPNSIDRLKTKTIMKHDRPGSAICIHANCVSIGCISFINRNYLPVFLAALGHNSTAYGQIKIHIFPFRFDSYSKYEITRFSQNVSHMSSKKVLSDWENLQEGYNQFNKSRKALKITFSKDKYFFNLY